MTTLLLNPRNDLPAGWRSARLSELASIDYGYTASANYMPEQPKFLRITDIQNDSIDWQNVPTCAIDEANEEKKRLQSDDIVIARTGNTGKSFLVKSPPRAVFASYLLRVRSYGDAMPQYLKAFFGCDSYWRQIIDSTMGTVQPNVNASRLGNLEVPLPPLTEQKRIVAILNQQLAAVDHAKKAADERLETAHDLRRVLLAETFHQGLTNNRVDLDQSRLGDVCEVVTGSTPSRTNARFYGGTLPWVNPSHLGLTKYVSDSAEHLTEEGLRHARLVPSGAILVACISGSRDNLGKASIAERPLTTNQQINSIIPGPNIDSEFLYYHLLALQPHLQRLSANTNQNIVNKSKVLELTIHVPTLETQRDLASRLTHMFDDVALVEDHFNETPRHLRELSENLLHRAFSGEI